MRDGRLTLRSNLRWACALIAFVAAIARAEDDRRFPTPPPGWDKVANWSGEAVTVKRIERGVEITWKDDSDVLLKLEQSIEYRDVANLGIMFEIPIRFKDVVWEPIGRTAEDICGQRVGTREEPAVHYWGFELLNARRSFKQVRFKPSTPAGTLQITRASIYERDQPLRYRRDLKTKFTAGEGAEPDRFGLEPLLAGVSGPDDWKSRRDKLRTLWTGVLGEGPTDKGELEIEVVESWSAADHHRRRIRFTSEGGDRIEAYLLVPKSYREGDKFPSVVCLAPEPAPGTGRTISGMEEAVGLAGEGGLAHALFLVKEGYVTLAFNPYLMRGESAEGQMIALKQRRPKWTGLGKMVYDAARAIDLLESFPFHDPKRVGVIGHGTGAKTALALAALDDRIAASVVSEAGVGLGLGNWFRPELLGLAARERLGELEGHQLLALAAPHPLLVIGGDAADGSKSRSYIEHAGRVYRLLGAPDALALYNHSLGKGFPLLARSEAYQWLETRLKGPSKE